MQTPNSSVPDLSPQSSSCRAAVNPLRPLLVPAWADFPWLRHGFSTRAGGVSQVYASEGAQRLGGELNLAFTAEDTAENVRENRRRFVEAVTGSASTPLLTVRQIHSAHSEVVPVYAAGEDAGGGKSWDTPEADGMLTRQPGILLGIMTADCVPVLVADPRNRVIAAFHAGWRGTVQRVVEHGIARMRTELGSDPEDLVAGIGPAIGPCCYTVGEEVHDRFLTEFAYGGELFAETPTAAGRLDLRLKLAEGNRRQLLAAGLEASRISLVGGCTSCEPEQYYSHRASGGRAGRMMSVIGIKAQG